MCAACDVINREDINIEKFAEAMDATKEAISEFLNENCPIKCENQEPITKTGEQDFVN